MLGSLSWDGNPPFARQVLPRSLAGKNLKQHRMDLCLTSYDCLAEVRWFNKLNSILCLPNLRAIFMHAHSEYNTLSANYLQPYGEPKGYTIEWQNGSYN